MKIRCDPFGKVKLLKPEKKWGFVTKSVDEIAEEAHKIFKYDSDGDIVQEKIVYKGQIYTKEYGYNSNKNITNNTGWVRRL